jgi:formyl-CoA transferase
LPAALSRLYCRTVGSVVPNSGSPGELGPGSPPGGHGPLYGVRVLELGNFIAGPTAGKILAEFGAEVIKVEQPGSGDQVRQWRLFGGQTSMLWKTLSRNKKSVSIDLRKPKGAEIVRRLARHCDVVIENYRPGRLESWGLGPDVLREENPGLIVIRVSGYGQTGPYRDRVGFGGVAEAMGGIRYVTGYPDRPPTRVGVSLADTLAGLYAVIGVLFGLLERRNNDSPSAGETVDVALYEAVYSIMESTVPEYTAYGVVRERTGNVIPGIAPSNTYRCKDGQWIVIGGNSNSIYPRLMRLVGRPDLADDPKFQENNYRAANMELLDDAIESWTLSHPLDEALQMLLEHDVPAGAIYSADRMLADPHFHARAMFLESDRDRRPDGGPVLFPGVVPKLTLHPGSVRTPAPEIGQHNPEILGGLLGLALEDFRSLQEEGVI